MAAMYLNHRGPKSAHFDKDVLQMQRERLTFGALTLCYTPTQWSNAAAQTTTELYTLVRLNAD